MDILILATFWLQTPVVVPLHQATYLLVEELPFVRLVYLEKAQAPV